MAFINQFPSPWDAVQAGQAIAAGNTRLEREGFENARSRSELAALRKASTGMGSGNFFSGYEGVPGAERPQYLKEMYANGDPDQAMKMEQMLAEPHKIQRSIQTAGAMEAQKREAQLASQKQMFDYFSEKAPQDAGASTAGYSGGEQAGGSSNAGLSGMKRTFKKIG